MGARTSLLPGDPVTNPNTKDTGGKRKPHITLPQEMGKAVKPRTTIPLEVSHFTVKQEFLHGEESD